MHSGTFVSDLHHFSSRSQTGRYADQIVEAARSSDLLVLGGDIFDFRWTTLGSIKSTIDEAIRWLNRLLDANPTCHLVYVLGNHDYDETFIAALWQLADRCDRFEYQRFFARYGDSIFLHGDVADGFLTASDLAAHRESWNSKIRSPIQSQAYRLATRMRVHVPIVLGAHRHSQTTQRITQYLDSIQQTYDDGLRRVFFGHTHRAMNGYQSNGLTFFNGGAPMDGLKFEVIRFDLTAKEVAA